MPQASQLVERNKSYGRQIPESHAEKVRPEKRESHQRQPEEKRCRRREIRRWQEKVTPAVCCRS